MVRVAAILVGIFLAAYVAVHLGYARLEKELSGRSCCGIAELPVPESGNQGEEKTTNRPTPANPASNRPVGKNPQEETSPRAADTGSSEQPVNNETPDFQVIIRRDIFQLIQEEQPINTDQQPAAVQAVQEPEAIPTRLNLTLQGTVLGDDETSRAIIIAEKQNEQKLYRIGDAVQGGIIESIERGKVILEVFGARETLMMKEREGGGPGPPRLPARFFRPEPRPAPDPVQDDIEEVDDEVRTTRRPPSIRPHRRINFRRNPIRNTPDTPDMEEEEEDAVEEELPVHEEELPLLD